MAQNPFDPASSTVYSSKYGRVLILDGDNYPQFKDSCSAALVSANALNITLGIELRPEGNGAAARAEAKDYDERCRKATTILYNSIVPSIQKRVANHMRDNNPALIWTELAKSDHSINPLWKVSKKRIFEGLTFDPKKESIRHFADKLVAFKDDLPDLKDDEILSRLLISLPEDVPKYESAVYNITRDRQSLDEAIIHLQSIIEPPKVQTTTVATAQVAQGTGRGGGNKGRGNRGKQWSVRGGFRGRGGDRGSNRGYRGGSRRDSSDRGGYNGGSSGSNRVNKSYQIDQNQCAFCHKKGHWQADCHAYQRAQKEVLDRQSSKKEDQANLASNHFEDGSLYLNDPIAHLADSLDTVQRDWIIDSGATQHFSNSKSDFKSIKRWSSPKIAKVAGGGLLEVEGFGDIELNTPEGPFTLKRAWYSSGFDKKLISTSRLNEERISILLEDNMAMVYHQDTGIPIFEAVGLKGLYVFNPDEAQASALEVEDLSLISKSMKEVWHRRLGHINYRDLEKMKETSDGVEYPKTAMDPEGEQACEGCLAGRMSESFHKSTDNRFEVKGQRLHMDISGIKPASVQGYHYFLLVVDDATRYHFVRFIKTKASPDVLPHIKEVIKEVELTTGNPVSHIRADNGKGEFGQAFQDYCKERGTRFEPSPPYKHSLNGVVEAGMDRINKIARTLIYQAKLPHSFWDFATDYAVWIRNCRPTKALPYGQSIGRSPHEAFKGEIPRVKASKIFGCAAYPLRPKQTYPSKYEPKILPGYIFVGVNGSWIWRLVHKDTLKPILSADVQFNESIFPRPRDPHPKPTVVDRARAERDFSRTNNEEPTIVVDAGTRSTNRSTNHPDDGAEIGPNPKEAVAGTEIGPDSTNPSTNPPNTNMDQVSGDQRDNVGHSQRDNVGHSQRDNVGYSQSPVQAVKSSIIKPTRSGRVPKPTAFADVLIAGEEAAGHSLDPGDILESVELKQALEVDPEGWKEAIRSELQSIKDLKCYELVERTKVPKNKRIIRSRIVLRNKLGANGVVIRQKARIVAKGFEQKFGFDYFETFASVVKFSTLRSLLAKAAAEDLEIIQIDVDTAFLLAKLLEEIYMEIPEFFELVEPGVDPKTYCLRLLKSLYGLKQAPRVWFMEVKGHFEKMGFKSSDADPNLFIKDNTSILLFVDDMLIIGPKQEVATVRHQITNKWKCKDMGDAHIFVGFEIERDRTAKTLKIHQNRYIDKLLKRFKLENCNPVKQPIPTGTILQKLSDDDQDGLLNLEETRLYQGYVGSYIYLANGTRLDICYAVGQLARHMANPRKQHLQLAKRLLRYLKGTKSMGIQYSTNLTTPRIYILYTDATWGTELDGKSVEGWVVVRAGGAISWASNRQKSTAQSTMEAEIMAANKGSKELAWLEKLTIDLGEKTDDVPILRIDNKAAGDLIMDPGKLHQKAKHIRIRGFYIQDDMVREGRMEMELIPGSEQPADILTKQLALEPFLGHLERLGLQ